MTSPSELSSRLRALSSDQLSVAAEQLQPAASLHDEDCWEGTTTYGKVEELVTRLVGTSSPAQA